MDKATFQNLAASMFASNADMLTSITHTRQVAGSYNHTTQTLNVSTVATVVKAMVSNYKAHLVDNSTILSTDLQVVALVSDLATMLPTDTFLIDSKTYNIVSINKDAANACWTLQVRM